MKKKIEPTILRGTRDFLPQQMMQRNAVMDTIRQTFEQFGYAPLETPILSPAETILGKYGDEGDRLTYSFTDRGSRKIALPYDLTVPFARYVAANHPELPMPFKRYQIQRVWRAERPQKGRLREFYQCDIDIIGSKELLCEAEVAKVITLVFERLKIGNIRIKLNSRRLLNAVLSAYDVPEGKLLPAIRIIDKIDKIGGDAVIAELQELDVSNAKEVLTALKPESTNKATLRKLSKYDTAELQIFLELCGKLSVPDENLQLDPTLARGLDYYTGLTFEVISTDADFGTICAGGRYDDLCGLFSDQDFSGVGVAFGFERIMLLLEQQGRFQDDRASSRALVTVFNKDMTANSLAIYNTLIASSVPVEIYLGDAKLGKQFKFANKKRIPLVIIQGPDELAKNEVTIRCMETGEQEAVPLDRLAAYVENYEEADTPSVHHAHMSPDRA